jgi:hypothetical protein
MTEQEQVQVIQADRDAVKDFFEVIFDKGAPTLTLIKAHEQAFARHRHTATAEALEAMREARDALRKVVRDAQFNGTGYWFCYAKDALDVLTRLTAAIAKIERDAECDGRALAALTYQDGQRSAPDGGN